MTQENLTLIVQLHEKWLRNESDGVRADLSNPILRGADLRGADLRGAYLSDAILRDADLSGANLSGVILTNADLSRTILHGADLRGAYLRGADLSAADLSGANLIGAIKVPMHCKLSHGVTEGQIHIGCDQMSIDEWDKFFASDSEFETPRGTPEFRQMQAVYNGYKAYLTTLDEEPNEQ